MMTPRCCYRALIQIPLAITLLLVVVHISAAQNNNNNNNQQTPFVQPEMWLPARAIETETASSWKDVVACCVPDDEACAKQGSGDLVFKKVVIGRMPQFTADQAVAVVQESVSAFDGGSGKWPQMSLNDRIQAIRTFFQLLKNDRERIVEILMWEIGKNRPDAAAEFDRTVQFAESAMARVENDAEYTGQWKTVGTTSAFVKRAAIGVIMCLAPYNYPLNESYAAVIPALLTGNVVVLKVPTIGGLAHLLTMKALAAALPTGTLNFVAGSGRSTMPPIMQSGLLDGLAFIGGSDAADKLIHAHPHPHRLKVFLQLEANNMGILLNDLFVTGDSSSASLENALNEAVIGSLSYNGQRCTALKLFLAPSEHAAMFAQKLANKVSELTVGTAAEMHADGTTKSMITPLPSDGRIRYMKELLEDALGKGATILNKGGGEVIGGDESTLMRPAVLYPVDSSMRLYHEEQFGPLIPVASYDDIETVLEFGQKGPYAQQVSIFTTDPVASAKILDRFSAVYGKVNLNGQCGRSPDTLPFSGRRSSALGVMSVQDALREFSVPTVFAYKKNALVDNAAVASAMKSVFLDSSDQ